MIDLGPRASFLLGMLYRPMTVQELHEMVGKGLDHEDSIKMLDEMIPTSESLETSLRTMWMEGPVEIARHMIRLERAGLAARAGGGPEAGLWFRT